MKYYLKIVGFFFFVFMAFGIVLLCLSALPMLYREWKTLRNQRLKQYGGRFEHPRFLVFLWRQFLDAQKHNWKEFMEGGAL